MKTFTQTLTKNEVLLRLEEHKRLDQIVQGIGFNPNSGRGCSVGCILDKYDHSAFETELGIPRWLAHLVDFIHEGLPNSEHVDWPIQFITAVPEGVDLDKLRHTIALRWLRGLEDTHPIVPLVIALHERALTSGVGFYEWEQLWPMVEKTIGGPGNLAFPIALAWATCRPDTFASGVNKVVALACYFAPEEDWFAVQGLTWQRERDALLQDLPEG